MPPGFVAGKHWKDRRNEVEVADCVDRQVLPYLLSLVTLRLLPYFCDEKSSLIS